MSGPCRLIILNAWSPTMSASFICIVIPVVMMMMMISGQSSLRLSARSGQWRCCCGANAWQVHFIFNECLADICHQSSSEHLGRLWINQWQALRRHDHPDGRVGELSVKGGREDDQRWGGRSWPMMQKTPPLMKAQCWQWTVFVRPRSVHGLVDCGQSWRSLPAEVLLPDGGGRGESAAHHQLRQSIRRMGKLKPGTRNSPRKIRISRWPPTSATVVTPWQATPPMVSCLSIHSTSGFINNNI